VWKIYPRWGASQRQNRFPHAGSGKTIRPEIPSDPEAFFKLNEKYLICLDEIQNTQDLFPVLRYEADRRKKNGQFLILGSASPNLIRQSSESLAGRIIYIELTPFLINEINTADSNTRNLWLRGGFPPQLSG
jgi:uncharacterized protein